MKAESHPAHQDPCCRGSTPGRREHQQEEGTESEDPSGTKGVMEEFIVHLARAVKDTQQEKKHFYHCSSPELFIPDCLLVKASRMYFHLN